MTMIAASVKSGLVNGSHHSGRLSRPLHTMKSGISPSGRSASFMWMAMA